MMEFNGVINRLVCHNFFKFYILFLKLFILLLSIMQNEEESRKRKMKLKTYSVVCLNEECGILEWVPNTIGILITKLIVLDVCR